MSYNAPGSAYGPQSAPADAPMIVVFERDEALAVPLLSQLRLATYDVRAARTPVELFDTLRKHAVALILIDLGNATASRREFWVALDAHRRGRTTQVLTFRQVTPPSPFDSEMEISPMALADLEIAGPHDLPLLVAAVCQRVPLVGGTPGGGESYPNPAGVNPVAGLAPLGPFGPVLGVAMGQGASDFSGNGAAPGAWLGGPGGARAGFTPTASPFANPAAENPFTGAGEASPFAQPDASNPFATVGQSAALSSRYAPQPSWAEDPPGGASYRPQGAGPTGGLTATRLEPLDAPARGAGDPFGPMDGAPTPTWPVAGSMASAPARDERHGDTPPGLHAVSDVWLPPDGDDMSLLAPPPSTTGTAAHLDSPSAQSRPRAGMEWPTQPVVVPADSDFPTYDTRSASDNHGAFAPELAHPESDAQRSAIGELSSQPTTAERSTLPVPSSAAPSPTSMTAPVDSGALTLPEERALGAVLVEGALLTPRRLEVLKGIKSMLASVEMSFKLGELALLFKFLSPDQLLAALLVSRQLVSPQQIAALGHIKQELGKSGVNYDLETLLAMFHILSHEELARLRADLI